MTEFETLMPQASAEAKAAFGDGGLYIEKVIERARHIEVQILGDGKRAVHCFERECSLQRAASEGVGGSPLRRAAAGGAGEALCVRRRAGRSRELSRGGTLEYLYDDVTRHFYFIEMNTRIQVEHPVTEMITGIDLVKEMIRICGGEPLRLRQDEITMRGHAIEVRINAEDPAKNFMPAPGTVTALRVPGGPGTRFDTMLYQGYQVPPFYDSLLAS